MSTQILFIALCFSFFGSLAYVTYFACKKYNSISSKTGKLKKFILDYMFPTLFVLFAIIILVYFTFVSPWLLFIYIFAGIIFVIAMVCFCNEYPYWGIFLAAIAIIGSFLLCGINFIEDSQKEEVVKIELNEFSEDDPVKEEILIVLNTEDSSNTNSTSSSDDFVTESSSSSEDENEVFLYSFMQYDNKKLKEKNLSLPFLLYTDKYEIIDAEENYIEITISITQNKNVYSYLGFTKPYEKPKEYYEYKVFINENNIKFD